jgi:methyltransferase (TIGR00027 family)
VVFELDQPKVLEFKAAALAAADAVPAARRHAIAVDLRHDWPAALRAAGFDPAAPTAWLAEGLLRYLPADAQDRLFADLAALSAPGSRFAANGGPRSFEQRPATGGLLRRLGIELDVASLIYDEGDRTDPREWFPAHGWPATAVTVVDMMAELGRPVAAAARAIVEGHILMSATRG